MDSFGILITKKEEKKGQPIEVLKKCSNGAGEESDLYNSLLVVSQRDGGSRSTGFAPCKGSRTYPSVMIREKSQTDKSSAFGKSYNNYLAKLPAVKWNEVVLQPAESIDYELHETTKSRPQEEITKFYRSVSAKYSGKQVPPPILTFDETNFPDFLLKGLKAQGYSKPTPIQSISWPCGLLGRDIVGIAPAGSGKTLSYLIPAILHVQSQPPIRKYLDGPIVLIVVPTRELAQQIHNLAIQYGADAKIRCTCLYGGSDKRAQCDQLAAGAQICVATPGRLIDMLRSRITTLERTTYLVLDEVDRLLNETFENNIIEILEQIRPDKQTSVWSATRQPWMEDFMKEILTNPIELKLKAKSISSHLDVVQIVDCCERKERTPKLIKLMESILKSEDKRTLIFVNSHKDADELGRSLRGRGWPVAILHSQKAQSQREFSLNMFRSGKAPFLLATNLASRGLDIKKIQFVINYDMAYDIEEYVHRIGRAGRESGSGVAYTFFTLTHKRDLARSLVQLLREAGQEICPKLREVARGSLREEYWDKKETSK